MILVCGIPSESPLAMVIEALESQNQPFVLFNQRHAGQMHFEFSVADGVIDGDLAINGTHYRLSDFCGVYTRLMDHEQLPELRGEAPDSPRRRQNTALHLALMHWMEIARARVVNRVAPMASNSSKPYQAQLIRQYGLDVPETLITNDPDRVLAFREQYQRIIYKSISGVRSIVQTFDDHDLERLERIRWCPAQFQAYVEGQDVRVHVIGSEVFATAIDSGATDYRYAVQQMGTPAQLTAKDLPDEIAEKCLYLAQGLGLAFAGIDLKFAPDGRVYCFEVNPCPGFSYYEANTGQPIAQAVARYLSGDD
jgi:glutathione synthase/RimK-type ligase-like ATP-grasp enzyme